MPDDDVGELTCELDHLATSKGRLLPDPESDPIVGLFYCLQDDQSDLPEYPGSPGYHTGVFLLKEAHIDAHRLGITELPVEYFESELDLINEIISRVRIWNPDVLAGWEVHAASWGYLSQRAGHEFGAHPLSLRNPQISRLFVELIFFSSFFFCRYATGR